MIIHWGIGGWGDRPVEKWGMRSPQCGGSWARGKVADDSPTLPVPSCYLPASGERRKCSGIKEGDELYLCRPVQEGIVLG